MFLRSAPALTASRYIKDTVAVAIESDPKQDPGKVAFYDSTDRSYINDVTGCRLIPDACLAG
jgi:hypothetical protein